MKKLLVVVFSLQLLLIFTTCSKEKRIVRDNTWELISIENVHVNSVLKDYPFYMPITLSIIEMVNETDKFFCEIKSSSDLIAGAVKIKNNKIDFQEITTSAEFGLAEYPQFTKPFADLLGDIDRYETTGYILILTGKKGEKISLIRKY